MPENRGSQLGNFDSNEFVGLSENPIPFKVMINAATVLSKRLSSSTTQPKFWMDSESSSVTLTQDGIHGNYADMRAGAQGGALTKIGLNMFNMKVEAEFDRTNSRPLTQRKRGSDVQVAW